MNVNEWMQNNRTDRGLAKQIICNDGTALSVQANEFSYCGPRADNAYPYHSVEIGFPSIKPSDEIMKYCEDPDDPTETVYGYVPVELVDKFIDDHGGFKI